jgi:hypothetical protein
MKIRALAYLDEVLTHAYIRYARHLIQSLIFTGVAPLSENFSLN